MLCWNKALWLAVPDHVTIFNQTEGYAAFWLWSQSVLILQSYYKICLWRGLQYPSVKKLPQIHRRNFVSWNRSRRSHHEAVEAASSRQSCRRRRCASRSRSTFAASSAAGPRTPTGTFAAFSWPDRSTDCKSFLPVSGFDVNYIFVFSLSDSRVRTHDHTISRREAKRYD